MKVVIQRVSEASVTVSENIIGSIDKGLLVFVGFTADDSREDINWIVKKIINLRIFADSQNQMNLSVKDTGNSILVISQFTLYASTKKGNRPSFVKAAHPDHAIPLYNYTVSQLENLLPGKIKTGKFGADMQVRLINDGPVTIVIDSKNKE